MSKQETVSKPLGGLYAGPGSGAQSATGPQITSTASMAARQPPTESAEAMKRQAAQQPIDTVPQAQAARNKGEMGQNDGRISIKFDGNLGQNGDGNGRVSHFFEFDLPNIVGTLSIAQMNREAIMQIIEEALVRKLGFGGVVRVK